LAYPRFCQSLSEDCARCDLALLVRLSAAAGRRGKITPRRAGSGICDSGNLAENGVFSPDDWGLNNSGADGIIFGGADTLGREDGGSLVGGHFSPTAESAMQPSATRLATGVRE